MLLSLSVFRELIGWRISLSKARKTRGDVWFLWAGGGGGRREGEGVGECVCMYVCMWMHGHIRFKTRSSYMLHEITEYE